MSAQWQREPIRASKISIELQTTLARIPGVPTRSTGNSCATHVTENESAWAINSWIAPVLLAHAALHAKSQGCK